MKKKWVKKARGLDVVKQNDIVQKTRYALDLNQQKTILYFISKIDSVNDTEFQDITVDLNELCSIMGIGYNSGKNIKRLKGAIQKLADKSMWVEMGTKIVLMRWLSRVEICDGTKQMTIRFDELMSPYLLQIKERFTQFKLINVLPMKSQYSIRLYELIKSHEKQGEWEITIEELKKLLFMAPDAYPKYQDFRQRVLDSATLEICNFTDLMVAFSIKRRNRAAYSITFEMCNILDENWTEGERRILNRTTVLDNQTAEVVTLKKKPTVEDVRKMRERQEREVRKRKREYIKPDSDLDDLE